MLTAHGVPQKGATEILSYVENSHYQLACQKHFEITHAVSSSDNTNLEQFAISLPLPPSHTHTHTQIPSASFSLEHPVQYFIESRKVRGGLVDSGAAAVKQEGAQQQQQPQHPPPSSTSPTSSAAGPAQTAGTPSDNQANRMAEFGDVSEQDLVDFDDEDDAIMDCNN